MSAPFDLELVEEIRAAGGDPSRLAALGERLAAEHARIDDALHEAVRWIDDGFFVEAVAYSEDAGNLVRRGRAVDDAIARITLDATRLPGALDRRRLDRLDVAYADVASIEDLLATHRRSNLSRASADDRLDAIDAIRRRHRVHPGWSADAEALERLAVSELERDVQQAAAREDAEALDALHRRIARRNWGRDLPDRVVATLRDTREVLRRRRIAGLAEDLASRLHRAFAAMDASEVAAIEAEWRSLTSPDGTGGGAVGASTVEAAESAFRWLATHREAEASDRRAAETIAELERLLDAGSTLEELRACRRRLDEVGGALPVRLSTRLESLELRADAAGRTRRRRRFAVTGALVLATISGAAYVAWRIDRDRRSMESIEEVARRVDRAEYERAEALLAELALEGGSEAFWSGDARLRFLEIEANARNAIADSKERSRRLDSALIEIASGLESDRADDPERETRLAELGRLQAIADAAGDADEPRLAGPRSEISARIDAISRRAAAQLRGNLLEIESAFAALATTGPESGPDEIVAERAALAALAADAASISIDPAAGPTELEAARSLRERLERRLAAATRRGESLESFDRRLRELPRSPDERIFLERYRTFVDEHGDVLAARGRLIDFEDGLAAAELAEAVAHWRRTASRSILATTPLDDPWHPADVPAARTLRAILAEHLSLHPRSPYASAAEELATLADSIAALRTDPGGPDDPAGIVAAELRATGFDELLRVPLANGGFVYRKAGGERVFDNALSQSGDLVVPAGRLLPRTDVSSPAAGGVERTMPATLLDSWLPRIENAPGSRVRGELLGLAAAAAAAEEADPMLQLAFLEAIHRVLARLPITGVDASQRPSKLWLDELDRRTPPTTPADWAADSPRGREALAAPRRLARLALSSMPDAAASQDRSLAAWTNLRDALQARSVAGVVEPDASADAWRFVGLGAGGAVGARGRIEGSVVVEGRGGGAAFVPVEIDDGVAVFLGPEPPPAPHLVFVR